jgi:hypothetical protein
VAPADGVWILNRRTPRSVSSLARAWLEVVGRLVVVSLTRGVLGSPSKLPIEQHSRPLGEEAENYLALLQLACVLLWFRRYHRLANLG